MDFGKDFGWRLFEVAVVAILVAFAFVLNALLNNTSFQSFGTAVAAVAAAVLTCGVGALAGIAAYSTAAIVFPSATLKPVLERLEAIETKLRSASSRIYGNINFIDNEKMGDLELSIDAREIWLISPDFHREICSTKTADGHSYLDINYYVRQNIERRSIVYRYFGPTRLKGDYPADLVRRVYKENCGDRAIFHFLSPELWERMPYTAADLIIFNAVTGKPGKIPNPEAYHELVGVERGYWLSIPKAAEWVETIKSLVPGIQAE